MTSSLPKDDDGTNSYSIKEVNELLQDSSSFRRKCIRKKARSVFKSMIKDPNLIFAVSQPAAPANSGMNSPVQSEFPSVFNVFDGFEEKNEESSERNSLRTEIYNFIRQARTLLRKKWQLVGHHSLPSWLKDNDKLIYGHRPQLHSYKACFKSIFRIHTETGNIWTHLLGSIAFIFIACYIVSRPTMEIQYREKIMFTIFFLAAILCYGFSFIFHTVYCHSESVGLWFNKLDYCGIALLTMGSFVPWLYYAYYCETVLMVSYMAVIIFLGTICIIVSMWSVFATPRFRPIRAGTFVAFGLSGCFPAFHYVFKYGFQNAVNDVGLARLIISGLLYIFGALIYTLRVPERLYPGKFDLWFQSHQIFHVFAVAGGLMHYYAIIGVSVTRLTYGDCINNNHIQYSFNKQWEL